MSLGLKLKAKSRSGNPKVERGKWKSESGRSKVERE